MRWRNLPSASSHLLLTFAMPSWATLPARWPTFLNLSMSPIQSPKAPTGGMREANHGKLLARAAGWFESAQETDVKLPFKVIYSDGYYLPIGAHVFPAQKYRLIHKRLLETGLADESDFLEPQPAS